MKNLFILGIIFWSLTTWASGVMTIDGKMNGKTAANFMILSQGEVFTVKKAALGKPQIEYLEKLRWHDLVHVDVPMHAIQKVQSVAKQ